MNKFLEPVRSILSRSLALIVAIVAGVALIALFAAGVVSIFLIAGVIGLTGLLLARLHGHQPLQAQRARYSQTVLNARLGRDGTRWEVDPDAR